MTVTWKVSLDWDRDGITAADEITDDVRFMSWDLGFVDPLERVAGQSRCELELNNADGKYSPENSAGTYFGKFDPHKRIKIESISTLGTITHWYGWLQSIIPDGNLDTPFARIIGTDSKPYLENKNVNYKLYQSTTADAIIRDIISNQREWSPSMEPSFVLDQSVLGTDTLALEADSFNFDTGLTTFTYAGDTWDDNTSAMEAIAQITRGEAGRFFYSREGSATFHARDNFANIGQTNIGTVTYNDYQDIGYSYGDDVINRVTMRIAPRTLDTTRGLIYSQPANADFGLDPDGEKTLRLRYESQDDETPIASVPEDCSLVVTTSPPNVALSINVEFFSRHAGLTLENRTSTTVSVTGIDVYGPNITRKNLQDITVEDNESIRKYGLRQLVIDAPLFEGEAAAKLIVTNILNKQKEPRGNVHSILFRTKSDESNLDKMLQWVIGTRFAINDTPTSHNQSYFIIGESHSVKTGGVHDATYYLSAAANEDYFELNTSQLNGDDVLFA